MENAGIAIGIEILCVADMRRDSRAISGKDGKCYDRTSTNVS